MGLTRKKYVVDKKFQFRMSLKAVVLPLLTILSISAVLLYYADRNNRLVDKNNTYINDIVDNQDTMIEMFLSTPAFQQSKNPLIKNGVKTFKKNIGMLKKISKNSSVITENSAIVFNFLVIMTIVQTIIIFALFIFFTHKISGPIHVMTNQLRQLKNGQRPNLRPLRKNDELIVFYNEFRETLEHISDTYNIGPRDDSNGGED